MTLWKTSRLSLNSLSELISSLAVLMALSLIYPQLSAACLLPNQLWVPWPLPLFLAL